MNDLNFTTSNTLLHHGILGQKWGVQNGPPYPLSKSEVKRLKKENKELIKQKKAIDKQNKLIDKNKTLNSVLENENVTYKQIKEQNRGPAYRKATSLANKATNSATSEAGKKVGAAVGAAVGVILAKEIKDFYNSKRGSFDVSKPVKNIKVDGGAKRKFWQSDIDVNDLNFTTTNSIFHHGIEGQKWGVRNGPPYPLGSDKSTGHKIKNKKIQAENAFKELFKRYPNETPQNAATKLLFFKNLMNDGVSFTNGELYEYPNEVVQEYYKKIAKMLDELDPPKRKDDSILEMVKSGESDVVTGYMSRMENMIKKHPKEVDLIISSYNPKKYDHSIDFKDDNEKIIKKARRLLQAAMQNAALQQQHQQHQQAHQQILQQQQQQQELQLQGQMILQQQAIRNAMNAPYLGGAIPGMHFAPF